MKRTPRISQASAADITDDWRWNALIHRTADEGFFYSVKTTGIYCRPSCGARLPRPENVRFHNSCKEAEAAGFRPCERCQPHLANPGGRYASIVVKACELIKTADEPPSLSVLAKQVGMSPFYFHRIFTRIVGLTPKAYADAHRAKRMRQELPRRATVTEAIYNAGYKSNSRFYEKSSEMLGMRPKDFRNGGIGTTIRFAVGECSLGSVLVACSDKGVCAILLGKDPNELVQDLQDRFPKANLIGGDRAFERVTSQVIGFVDEPHRQFPLPLDVQGTAFQQRVWQALREIPAGKTESYSEIAARIGKPKAIRAVASACAANAIAVAIPCHRVVRMNGNLSGYRWGVECKRALLEKECSGNGSR